MKWNLRSLLFELTLTCWYLKIIINLSLFFHSFTDYYFFENNECILFRNLLFHPLTRVDRFLNISCKISNGSSQKLSNWIGRALHPLLMNPICQWGRVRRKHAIRQYHWISTVLNKAPSHVTYHHYCHRREAYYLVCIMWYYVILCNQIIFGIFDRPMRLKESERRAQ